MRSPKRKLRRALVDDQFDRTDVEAERSVELTVTNCPFGLTIISTAHAKALVFELFGLVRPVNIQKRSGQPSAVSSRLSRIPAKLKADR